MSPRLTLLYLVIQAEDNAQMNMRVTIRTSFTHIQLTLGCFNYPNSCYNMNLAKIIMHYDVTLFAMKNSNKLKYLKLEERK